jgi:ribosome-interacting GTPase 1
LTNLAGVYSEVAAYEFTTLTTVPGVIRYKGAKIQLLDLPGIIEGAKVKILFKTFNPLTLRTAKVVVSR